MLIQCSLIHCSNISTFHQYTQQFIFYFYDFKLLVHVGQTAAPTIQHLLLSFARLTKLNYLLTYLQIAVRRCICKRRNFSSISLVAYWIGKRPVFCNQKMNKREKRWTREKKDELIWSTHHRHLSREFINKLLLRIVNELIITFENLRIFIRYAVAKNKSTNWKTQTRNYCVSAILNWFCCAIWR